MTSALISILSVTESGLSQIGLVLGTLLRHLVHYSIVNDKQCCLFCHNQTPPQLKDRRLHFSRLDQADAKDADDVLAGVGQGEGGGE